MTYLSVSNVKKQFGPTTALDGVDISMKKGEFICLLGPSGCGKTTLLRIIAGLEMPTSGCVSLTNKDITGYSPASRNVGIVFQSYALFPNLNAFENIAFGLKNKKMKKNQLVNKVNEVLDLVNLRHIAKKYPAQLSGGQQQRVALARALVLSPEILLLDEPLSALDAKVREELRHEIKKLQRETGITTIMVTHDQEEALTMADRIVVMNNAVIEQIGTPEEIYENPESSFVADFIGEMNFLDSTTLPFTKKADEELIAIRPQHISLYDGEENGTIQGKIEQLEFRGAFYRLLIETEQFPKKLIADISLERMKTMEWKTGKIVYMKLNEKYLVPLSHESPIASNIVTAS